MSLFHTPRLDMFCMNLANCGQESLLWFGFLRELLQVKQWRNSTPLLWRQRTLNWHFHMLNTPLLSRHLLWWQVRARVLSELIITHQVLHVLLLFVLKHLVVKLFISQLVKSGLAEILRSSELNKVVFMLKWFIIYLFKFKRR